MCGILAWVESHGALAGWAQALASVAAIYWAGRLGRQQIVAQQKIQVASDRLTKLQKIDSFVAMADVALQEVGNAEASTRNDESTGSYARLIYEPRTFEGLLNALNAFPIHELPTATCVGAAQRFRDGMSHAALAINKWVAGVRRYDVEGERGAAAYVVDAAEYLRSQIDVMREQRGETAR